MLPRRFRPARSRCRPTSTSAGDEDDAKIGWEFAKAANSPENLVWLLQNVGWLPNRSGIDYTPVTSKQPAFAAFVNYPQGYKFFTLPSIGPIEEILTRVAAQLVVAFGDSSMATDDAKIDAFLKKTSDEVNTILDREGLLAK